MHADATVGSWNLVKSHSKPCRTKKDCLRFIADQLPSGPDANSGAPQLFLRLDWRKTLTDISIGR
jgi:hypothetical protein